jgi:hypothetical protein
MRPIHAQRVSDDQAKEALGAQIIAVLKEFAENAD